MDNYPLMNKPPPHNIPCNMGDFKRDVQRFKTEPLRDIGSTSTIGQLMTLFRFDW